MMPIMSMHAAWTSPPTVVEVLRPQRSASKNAGIVVRRMTSADTPDARKEAVLLVRPADWKRSGAYYYSLVNAKVIPR